jgi:DNA-binding response OmpR family regulator
MMETAEIFDVKLSSTPFDCQVKPPHRILVVDDDAAIRCMNAEVLTRSGYYVDAAKDGAVAWDKLQLNSYDLLVIDNAMPNVTGVELLSKLHTARIALPVIMATGTLPIDEFTRHPWLEPDAILLKPYTMEELLQKVKEVLDATKYAREQTAGKTT